MSQTAQERVEDGKGMGKDAAAQIPFLWDAPKESSTHPGAAELWDGPKPLLLSPKATPVTAGTGGFMAVLFPQLQEL